MTLSDLATLAAEKVPGFVPSYDECPRCRAVGQVFPVLSFTPVACPACDGSGLRFDNSPAALAMAVMVCVAKGRDVMLLSAYRASVARDVGPGPSYSDSRPITEPEDVARALLTALLRAHGVEVPSE